MIEENISDSNIIHDSQIISEDIIDVLIIGSGPAGMTAAIYAARGNVKTTIIEGPLFGGQLMYTASIENYPGFFSNDPAFITSGPNLMFGMRRQAEELGIDFITDSVIEIVPALETVKIYLTDDNSKTQLKQNTKLFTVKCEAGIYYARSVIVATGSSAKWLDLPLIEKYKGNGVATCATCDGFAYRGKDVAIIGGGNTAAEDAIYLAQIARRVTLIHRRDTMRAEQILQKTLFAMPNVSYVWNSEAIGLLEKSGEYGDEFAGLQVENIKTKEKQDIFVDGLFIAIGHIPNTSIVKDLIPLTSEGYVDTSEYLHDKGVVTCVPGLFVAGDMMDFIDRQAITAAAYGCMAARRALHFLYHS